MTSPASAGTLVGPSGRVSTPMKLRSMKRKLEDTAREPNKSSRYATRATTRATAVEGEVDHAIDPRKGNSSNINEGRVMLQKALELLGEYRAEFQGLRETIKEQNGIISNQQEVIRDLKETAKEQQNTTRELSQQLEDTKKQMGDQHDECLSAISYGFYSFCSS
ncbi:hypothetical protein AUP68_11296 [Ilyonectria robusta]